MNWGSISCKFQITIIRQNILIANEVIPLQTSDFHFALHRYLTLAPL